VRNPILHPVRTGGTVQDEDGIYFRNRSRYRECIPQVKLQAVNLSYLFPCIPWGAPHDIKYCFSEESIISRRRIDPGKDKAQVCEFGERASDAHF
jgi:hypothetical protein